MSRRALAWLVAVPIAAVGMLAGHASAWRVEIPDAHERAQALAETGHGYSLNIPILLAFVVGALIIALVLRAHAAFRGRPRATAPSWAFALLSPLAFLIREAVERTTHSGELTLSMLGDRTLLIGLLIQLPFGLLTVLVSRALCTIATAVGSALAPSSPGGRMSAVDVRRLALELHAIRPPALALGYGERGPPARC